MITALSFLWTLPNTLLGLLLAVPGLLTGGRMRFVDGVCEVSGGLVAWMLRRLVPIAGGAAAITIGFVVLGRDAESLSHCRGHESVHVRQYRAWGPLFIPAYLIASLVAWIQGRHAYRDNYFEVDARTKSGE
jgi:hypothetical protein